MFIMFAGNIVNCDDISHIGPIQNSDVDTRHYVNLYLRSSAEGMQIEIFEKYECKEDAVIRWNELYSLLVKPWIKVSTDKAYNNPFANMPGSFGVAWPSITNDGSSICS